MIARTMCHKGMVVTETVVRRTSDCIGFLLKRVSWQVQQKVARNLKEFKEREDRLGYLPVMGRWVDVRRKHPPKGQANRRTPR
ncbi:hypothetical protein RUM43_006582 [Polyplax serrata]|uniref:Uncharacterized protein n=1 Tax=Polyplax serrata TaxID=468196 RepID=A0AAN8S3T5_POLSC